MKSKDVQTIRLLQRIGFEYKAENTSLVRRLSNIVENAQNNKFIDLCNL